MRGIGRDAEERRLIPSSYLAKEGKARFRSIRLVLMRYHEPKVTIRVKHAVAVVFAYSSILSNALSEESQHLMSSESRQGASPLFMHYVIQLVFRFLLFGAAIWLYWMNPSQLDIGTELGLSDGIGFVDIVFAVMAFDLVTKLLPHAKIAMGSRKQYGEFHVPTARMFSEGIDGLRKEATKLVESALRDTPNMAGQVAEQMRQAMEETAQGIYEAGRQLAYSIDILRMLPWPEEDLTAEERLRESIRRNRMHEVVPVIVFWLTFNVAVGLLLDKFGFFNPSTVLLWVLFYFMFDMISVVLWCPLQLVFMRNRCCTTCQIFNWDGIMTSTPLFAIGCWFSWLLILLSAIVLLRWELAFLRHPERFDERTNASLQCANCTDKLCHLRNPITPRRRT